MAQLIGDACDFLFDTVGNFKIEYGDAKKRHPAPNLTQIPGED